MNLQKNKTTGVPLRPKSSKLRKKEKFLDFLCVLPALVFFAIFVYYPIGSLFRISLTDSNLMKKNVQFVGFKNYDWLFNGTGWGKFTNALTTTALYTLGEVLLTVVGGILLALLFNRMTKSFNAMRAIVILPKYIAVSSSALVFIWILNEQYGILNFFLNSLGMPKVNWLGSEKTALLSVLLLTAWRVVGYAMMIYLSAIKGISNDYYEAASLDGANAFHKFRYITLPLLSPTTLFLVVTTFIASMKVYQSVEVMTGGGPYEATNVIVYWIYNLAFVQYRVDRAAVVGCIFFLILLVSTMLTMKWSQKKVNYDA